MARKVFPSNPNTNDVFTSTRGKKFQWNGKVWKRTQDTNVESMTLDSSADEKLALHGSDNPTIRFREGSDDKGNLHWKASTGEMRLVNEEYSQELRLGQNGVTVTGNLDVTGNLEVTGTTTFNGGTLTLGDSATDNVVFGADVNSSITPNTDDAYDLGSSSKQWRNLYIDGTANIDSLVADTADINGGTVDGAAIGGNSASSGAFTTLSASGQTDLNGDINLGNQSSDTVTLVARFDSALVPSADNTYDLGTSTLQWGNLYIDGTANIDSLVADTADINGGTVDGATIGGTTPAAGTFTNLNVNGELRDGDGAFGTSGQVLSSDGTDTAWVNAGSLTAGAAALVGVTAVSDDASHFMAFVDSSSGNENIKVDTGLTYNPSSNILTASSFSGALNGIVGGTTPAAGTFTTLVANGNVDLGSASNHTVTIAGKFDSNLVPSSDDTYDLGSSSQQWRNLYIDGSAFIDSLTADTADIDGGTIDGAAIGGSSASTGAFTSVTVSTTLDVSGAAIFDGNVALGNATSDTITATGRFNSSLVPSTDDARDLGTSSLQWRDLYIDGTGNIDTIQCTNLNGSILTIGGNSTLGDATSDTITANGRFASDLVPSSDGANALGTTALRWSALFADAATITNDVSVGGNLEVIGNANITGTLTYEDVTNIDSVGVVTARSGLVVSSGGANITGGITGDLTGDVTGNADTATTLATARNIGGVSFDGSANITLPGVNASGDQDTSGNAATATTLETARTIGGVSFDGSANITLPGVNASGDQDTSGNAATATTLATSRTLSISSDATGSASFNGGADADIAVTLANSGVTAGTYGSSSAIPAITVDAKGRITSATTSAIDSTSVSNGGESVSVSSGGQITSSANHDFDAGIDVTGNITVTGTVDGRDVATDGTKLDGIAAGAEVNVATNLSVTTTTTTNTIASSTGTNATIGEATASAAGLMSSTHHDKLDGIASGATNVSNNNQLTNGAGYITSSGTAALAEGLTGTPNITVGTISCGNITSSGTVTANSDAKLKKNVATVSNALDKVNLLRGVEFDYIANDKHSIGVIAQEVEAVLPDLVEGDETKSVAYGNLTAVLIEAVKELTAEVNTLKAELNTLKGE